MHSLKYYCMLDWRTNNAVAPRFYGIKENSLRLYACQVKDEQFRRSTLEVKDEQIRLSLDAWGQGLRACLHGSEGPQVGEVTRLAVVEK